MLLLKLCSQFIISIFIIEFTVCERANENALEETVIFYLPNIRNKN